LIAKTHDFISYHDQCLARDYFKACFDECEESEDFELEYKEFMEVKDSARLSEMLKTNQAILYKTLYEIAIERCNEHPKGTWMPKLLSENYLRLLSDVKRCLKEKKLQE
jgi:hypothetical protein